MLKKLFIPIVFIFLFTGCANRGGYQPTRFTYFATTKPAKAHIYCGYDKNNLKYCFDTPFFKATNYSLGWSHKYFQAKKEGYFDSQIIKHPSTSRVGQLSFHLKPIPEYKNNVDSKNNKLTSNPIKLLEAIQLFEIKRKNSNNQIEIMKPTSQNDAFVKIIAKIDSPNFKQYLKPILVDKNDNYIESFLSSYTTKYKPNNIVDNTKLTWYFVVNKNEKNFKLVFNNKISFDIKVTTLKEKIDEYLSKKDLDKLQELIQKEPSALNLIPNEELKLALTGPKELPVYKVIKLFKKKKMSEILLISQIKRVKTPYKEFTLKEIELLQKMGLSDNLIAAMIDVTTKLNDIEKMKENQIKYLEMQKKINKQRVIRNNHQNYPVTNKNSVHSPTLKDKIQNKLIEEGAKQLFNRLF